MGDYHICDHCGAAKTFYDANMNYEVGEDGWSDITYDGHRVFSLCSKCSETHEIIIQEKRNDH